MVFEKPDKVHLQVEEMKSQAVLLEKKLQQNNTTILVYFFAFIVFSILLYIYGFSTFKVITIIFISLNLGSATSLNGLYKFKIDSIYKSMKLMEELLNVADSLDKLKDSR